MVSQRNTLLFRGDTFRGIHLFIYFAHIHRQTRIHILDASARQQSLRVWPQMYAK